MVKIRDVKKEKRHREWMAQIEECQRSGMGVREWCKKNNISPNTYYSRRKKIRNEIPFRQSEPQSIVPVSVSAELAEKSKLCSESVNPVESPKSELKTIKMRKDGIEIELPENTNEQTVLTLLKGLRQC